MSDGIDWDDAYANAPYIEGADQFRPRWAAEAAAYRQNCPRAELDVAYGAHERERFDLFAPDRPAAGLLVFIHGGYWKAFDKSSWSHLARGAVEAGWAVAAPGYVLAPEARLTDIARQVARAIAAAAERVAGPIRLTGHSAGGHLATRMISAGTPLEPNVLARVERVVSISGLHDLRPLMKTTMNEILRIDEPEAASESPALLAPVIAAPVTAWVGGAERPEFLRQCRALADAWPNATAHVEPGRHHFDVIEGLTTPGAPLLAACV